MLLHEVLPVVQYFTSQDILGAKIVVVGRYGVDRRGNESVDASLQGRYMSRPLGHRLYRGITPESNLIP